MKKVLTFVAVAAASLSLASCANSNAQKIDSLSYAIGADIGLNLSLGMKDFDLDREIVLANIDEFYKNGDVMGEEIKEVRNKMMQYQYSLLMPYMYAKRSQDMLAANAWNVCQYAILVMMLAQVCDMVPGELLHVISDCHIYDRHVDIIKELITRPQYPAPKVSLNPEVKDFYAFTTDDLIVEDYVAGPQVKNIPIAV